MFCCCNSSYTGLPCCCPANYSTTTTTTCPFGICCDPSCQEGEICEEVYSSNCAVYNGPEIITECFTIEPNTRLTEILESIISRLDPCITTTTTTTVCQRPTGLSQFNFSDTIICSGVPTQFSGSETLTCQALYDFYNTPGCNQTQGFVVEASELIVGETVYSFGGTDCSYPADGYYLYVGITSSIIHVVGGVIQSISDCTTTTTTQP